MACGTRQKQTLIKMSAKKASMGTFQPLRHRSGTMRDRLHNYTKRTLGAGGSMNEAVSSSLEFVCVVSTAFRFVGGEIFSGWAARWK